MALSGNIGNTIGFRVGQDMYFDFEPSLDNLP